MSGGEIDEKLFIFLGFDGKEAKFLKATSKTGLFDANPELMSGCVVYAADQVREFPKPRTIIDAAQPNLWSIRKSVLIGLLTREPQRLKSPMPADFDTRLRRALNQARALSAEDRAARLKIIGPPT